MRLFKAGLFSLLAFLMTILALEVLLSAVSFLLPRAEMVLAQNHPLLSKDEALLWKGNPNIPGHDKAGFRNQEVLERADLVVLGDSQSYGFGLDGASAWPEQLKKNSRFNAYSFALPGYGPVQQLILMDRVLSLKPKKIIYALYPGNDFYESYAVTYDSGKRSDLKSSSPEVARAISAAEMKRPLLAEIKSKENACGTVGGTVSSGGARAFLAAHSKVYGLARAVRRIYDAREKKTSQFVQALEKTEAECLPFESRSLKTFFTPAYRLTGLNQNDSRIQEGFEITLRALREISGKAEASGADFLLLVIPTKESVFYRKALVEKGRLPEDYQKLADSEAFYLEKLSLFLERENIRFENLLTRFEIAVESGVQPYFDSSDNHLSEEGQRLTAEAAREWAEKSEKETA